MGCADRRAAIGCISTFLLCALLPSATNAAVARGVAAGRVHSCALLAGGSVQCRGGNSYGQLGDGTTTSRSTPANVIGLAGAAVALSAGQDHTCALIADGSVQCWGRNTKGQIGDGTMVGRLTPVTVSGLTSGAVSLSAGSYHTCALTAAGGVKCWGQNSEGQLGNGATTASSTPVDVTGLVSVASVASGHYHTCAVSSSGGAKCWGYNYDGQLGDNSFINRSTATDVTGLASGVLRLAAGENFTCALMTSGAVECWGGNSYGQLGDGTANQHSMPVSVSGMSGGVADIAVGWYHACAVLGTGSVRCWGANSYGQLGDGTVTDRWTAGGVSGLGSGVAAATAGLGQTCVLMANGGGSCWGNNNNGQLGDGTTTSQPTPVGVIGLTAAAGTSPTAIRQVDAGAHHTCAMTAAGGVECWGENAYGQIGDGTTTERTLPTAVPGLMSGVARVVTGYYHTCVLTRGGGVKCWGQNYYGQLGNGTTTDARLPVDVTGLASGVAALVAGASHTCVVTTTGAAKCWGANADRQVGDGTMTDKTTPVDVNGLPSGVAAMAAGLSHTCAMTTTGGLKCWGSNTYGELGDSTTSLSATPVWVSGLSGGVSAVYAGGTFTCALTSAGAVKCWGKNTVGQVGDGTTTQRLTPTTVSGLTSGVSALDVGDAHACVRTDEGRVRCWGLNTYGGLGDGTLSTRTTPVDVPHLETGVSAVIAGGRHTCAVRSLGGLQCWGWNSNGQLGDGTTNIHVVAMWVTGHLSGTGMLAAGAYHTCRITVAGGVQCWGENSDGQLGDGTTRAQRTPVDVRGLTNGVAAIVAGSFYTCALTTSGGVQCWGDNERGQLGDGGTSNRATPAAVAGLAEGIVSLAAGNDHACALTASGGVKCWGWNNNGQLGDAATGMRTTPAWVAGLTSGVTAVFAGGGHTCALTAAGGAQCWGLNASGQLGNGTTVDATAPVPVSGLSSGVRGLGAGAHHTCAITSTGEVVCTGDNSTHQLGEGTSDPSSQTPVHVMFVAWSAGISAGGHHTCAVSQDGWVQCWGQNTDGELGFGTTGAWCSAVSVAMNDVAGALALGESHSCAVLAKGGVRCWGDGAFGAIGDGMLLDRPKPAAVRGFKFEDTYDTDTKSDIAVYRPSAGTWFSLDSSKGNGSYQARGWGVDAQGDVPVPGDYDGDGIVDPTVFRPSVGTWFILNSSSSFTTWSYFGWGTTGDTPVPADYDGDGITDAAVYHPSTGTWYIRLSNTKRQWSVAFGNATDVPIPGHYDADGKADIAVYRPSTGTWFVLTSSSGWASYWYKGWGVNANGDTPAPGDYDGDGKLDLCVFRPSTGSWYVLESQYGFTTWRYIGWGASGDTVVPADYDGDGVTDAAVYRPSTYTWYIRPSSGATQWSVVFGAAGDVPLVR